MLPKLPLGVSTFRTIRTDGSLYVDKTKYAYDLLMEGGRRFFLARPRRFGKSLFVSTLHEILAGNKELFDGLWIAQSDYDWKPHAVINLDMSIWSADNAEDLKKNLCKGLVKIAEYYSCKISVNEANPVFILVDLAGELHTRFGRVAFLADEYDHAILRCLHNRDEARKVTEVIRSLFTAVKGLDRYWNVLFITGIVPYSQAGVFSGMNNLDVITFDEKYAGICGYTDKEIDSYFTVFIDDWARKKGAQAALLRDELRLFYNGYSFTQDTTYTLYNPFSILNAIKKQSFAPFWITSGASTFLINEIQKEYRRDELAIFDPTVTPKQFVARAALLGVFEIGKTPLSVLMFQAGYLTIKGYDERSNRFQLSYPNREVKVAFQTYIVAIATHAEPEEMHGFVDDMALAFDDQRLDEAVDILKKIFARVPYILHIQKESYYHSLFQVICGAAGLKVWSEQMTSHARIDIILECPHVIYVVEIKLNKPPEEALEQIVSRDYANALVEHNKPVVLLGLAFQREPEFFDITYVSKPKGVG